MSNYLFFIKLPFSNEVDAWAGLFLAAACGSTSQIIVTIGIAQAHWFEAAALARLRAANRDIALDA